MRGAAGTSINTRRKRLFLLTRLMRGAARHSCLQHNGTQISTHAPHARRGEIIVNPRRLTFISTHAPHARRGGRRPSQNPRSGYISTHAPHARRGVNFTDCGRLNRISTHAPHARRGIRLFFFAVLLTLFLLTRLMRGAARYPFFKRTV